LPIEPGRDIMRPSVHRDLDNLTLTVAAEFAGSASDGEGLGPPTYPATVVAHDLTPGAARHLLHDRR
jgi:hypothetical protein